MSDEARALVDRRWQEYGIDLGDAAANGARREACVTCCDVDAGNCGRI